MPMLFGSALSFGSFVFVVGVAQISTLFIFSVLLHVWALGLRQWFPTGEEFQPREEFHEFRGGYSTLQLSYLFSVQ